MTTEPAIPPNTDWVFRQFLYEDVLTDLDEHFRRLPADYMPIKGAYLICAGLAKQISSRVMFDIDILVRENDFDAVISHFVAFPNASVVEKSWPRYKKGWPFEVSFCYPFQGRSINIDIHKLINFRQRFLLPPESLFSRGTKQGPRRTLPCAEDALAICLCHHFSHVSHIFSWSVFDDIALLTYASVDWIKFWKIAQSTGIMAFMYYVLKMFTKRRGAPSIPFPAKTLRCAYADLFVWAGGFLEVSVLPRIVRRALIELPFCRDPAGLIYDKLRRSISQCELMV